MQFNSSYQLIDLNGWIVHESLVKRDTYNTAISQFLKGNYMDYVQQANSLAKDKKIKARQLFKESFLEVAHKDYVPLHHDALIDLSALFGVKWFAEFKNNEFESANATLYAESNTAFNYANLDSIVRGNIMAVLKHRVDDENRISEERIKDIMKQLCFLLTNTTATAVRENLDIY